MRTYFKCFILIIKQRNYMDREQCITSDVLCSTIFGALLYNLWYQGVILRYRPKAIWARETSFFLKKGTGRKVFPSLMFPQKSHTRVTQLPPRYRMVWTAQCFALLPLKGGRDPSQHIPWAAVLSDRSHDSSHAHDRAQWIDWCHAFTALLEP